MNSGPIYCKMQHKSYLWAQFLQLEHPFVVIFDMVAWPEETYETIFLSKMCVYNTIVHVYKTQTFALKCFLSEADKCKIVKNC